MSADLFAAFGDLSHSAAPQQNQQRACSAIPNPAVPAAAGTTSGPFASSTSNSPVSWSQNNQQSSLWPPLQHPTTGQPQSWLTSPVEEPQKDGDLWGDIGNLGGGNGFKNQSTAFPAPQLPAQAEEDDDGWGDFEVAPANPPPQSVGPSAATDQPRARATRASTIDMMSNKLLDLDLGTSTPEPWQQRPSWEKEDKQLQPRKPVKIPDPNVLFDADFEEEDAANDDDEFGDFETGTPDASNAPQAAPASSALDLLSLGSAPAPPKKHPPGLVLSNAGLQTNRTSYPDAPKSPYGSFQDRKPDPVKQLQVKPPTAANILREANEASPSPVTAWPAVENDGFDNKWEEFKDLPDMAEPAVTKPSSKSEPKPTAVSEWEWQDWGGAEDQPAKPAHDVDTQPHSSSAPTVPEDKPGPPPTNIPPPAILLSLFPQLLDLASASLLKPLLALPPSSPAYQRVLSAPVTLTFLQGYLSLARVAARLAAGRKHRWHRDKFLAQGMSISAAPSASGGGGQRGMKLASVDKSQSASEDREAAEVAGFWKEQVGRLRGVVAGVNAAHAKEGAVALRVPEVAVGLAVTTAKGVPTAPRACVVCGLKRDERVAKVDVEVEDSFGEWWVEFWGHRECRNFWVRHERELRQR